MSYGTQASGGGEFPPDPEERRTRVAAEKDRLNSDKGLRTSTVLSTAAIILAVALALVMVLSSRSTSSAVDGLVQSQKTTNDILNRRNVTIEQGNALQKQFLCVSQVNADFLSAVTDFAIAPEGSSERVESVAKLIRIQVRLDHLESECPLQPVPAEPEQDNP